MMTVRQKFPKPPPLDLRAALREQFASLRNQIKPGASIAVAVGSRGIANLQNIVAAVLEILTATGAKPFIVPAMGSHGGATPDGQLELLAEYGITEKRLGVPIRAEMEAESIGTTEDGVGVFFSRVALQADGVVVINRVKPHTDFLSETLGSGILKMLVIGLGKRVGAANFHAAASRFGYERVIRASARISLGRAPILCGVAIVENQFHDTANIAVLLSDEIERREPELFAEARRLMPRLPFDDIDLLIVDRLGKNISGAGLDPNVIGRSIHGYSSLLGDHNTTPRIRRLFVRELTPESHGNAVGIGFADFTTARLVRSINRQITTLNALTALTPQSVKVPIHFETDREAISRALESLALPDPRQARVVRIADTLSLEVIEASEAWTEQIQQNDRLAVIHRAEEMKFDSADNLAPLGFP